MTQQKRMTKASISLRDEAVLRLSAVLSTRQIARILYQARAIAATTRWLGPDLAVVDQRSQYVEARRHVPIQRTPGGRTLQIDEATAEALENYLNAQPPGRPYLDYRPDVGPYAFPSARTGGSISQWMVSHIQRRHGHANKGGGGDGGKAHHRTPTTTTAA